MKKIFSIILCAAVALVSGCSGVSQDEYNSVFEEKTELKYNNEGLQNERDTLQKELEALKSEMDKLQHRLDQTQNSGIDYCFDISTWMLGRPQSSIVKHESSKYDDNVDLETTFYMENSEFTIKMVHTMKDIISPTLAAIHIASYEKATDDGMPKLMDDQLTEYVIIYRYASGAVIMSSYWYLDKNNSIQHQRWWTSYGQKDGIVDKFNEMIG